VIKQPLLFGISMVLLLIAGGFAIERLWFLSQAEKTQGTVTQVTASNGQCGGGRRRSSHACTRFTAHIGFAAPGGNSGGITIGAGNSRGHGQPITRANYRVSQKVPVVYDPHNVARAYHDSLMSIWNVPIFIMVAQVATLVASMCESRRKRS
jgi:hypothetical protein